MVVPGGQTFTVDPERLPGCQLYVTPPVPVRLVHPPVHTEVLFPALATGDWLTVTITGGETDDPHPDPAGQPVPVTMAWKYKVDVSGPVFSVGFVAPGIVNQFTALVETSH